MRGDTKPIPIPPSNQRQTVYGGITLDGQTYYMATGRVNDRSFTRYLDKLRRSFGQVAVMADNAAYHDSGRVRRYLKKNSNFVKLIVLPPYSLPESGRMAVAQRQGGDAAHFQAAGQELFQAEGDVGVRVT